MLFAKEPVNPFAASCSGQEGSGQAGLQGGEPTRPTSLDTIVLRGLSPAEDEAAGSGGTLAFTGRFSAASACKPAGGVLGSAVARVDLQDWQERRQLADSFALCAFMKDAASRALLGAAAWVCVQAAAGSEAWDGLCTGDKVGQG